MIREEFIWLTLGLLVVALLLRPKNTQIGELIRLAVATVTLVIWVSSPGILTSHLFTLFILPLLAALFPGDFWKKTAILYGIFHVPSMLVLFGQGITLGSICFYIMFYTASGFIYSGIFGLCISLWHLMKQAVLKRHKRMLE